jgi:hypothetical protein
MINVKQNITIAEMIIPIIRKWGGSGIGAFSGMKDVNGVTGAINEIKNQWG